MSTIINYAKEHRWLLLEKIRKARSNCAMFCSNRNPPLAGREGSIWCFETDVGPSCEYINIPWIEWLFIVEQSEHIKSAIVCQKFYNTLPHFKKELLKDKLDICHT